MIGLSVSYPVIMRLIQPIRLFGIPQVEAPPDPEESSVARPLACYPFEGPTNCYCSGFADDPQHAAASRAMEMARSSESIRAVLGEWRCVTSLTDCQGQYGGVHAVSLGLLAERVRRKSQAAGGARWPDATGRTEKNALAFFPFPLDLNLALHYRRESSESGGMAIERVWQRRNKGQHASARRSQPFFRRCRSP